MEIQSLNHHEAAVGIVQNILNSVTPPPDLLVSEWANETMRLSAESSAEPGRYSTDRTPYVVEILDVMKDDDVTDVTLMSSAQIAKTTLELIILGYYIDQDPSPVLFMLPTLGLAEAISKDRIAPMIRDVPALKKLVGDPKSRNNGNTLLHKQYPGGHVTLCGANSPASLSSRPVKVLLADEVDRFPISAGTEGDPLALGKKRTTTYVDTRKHFQCSTPTDKGASRIDLAYSQSDQRKFHVPCPHCNEYQVLKKGDGSGSGGGLKWKKEETPDGTVHYPDTVEYVCEHNGCIIHDCDRTEMLSKGKWIADKPFNGHAGFHLNQLYSPWVSWESFVKEFIEAKDHPETLKVFVNTALGEPWESKGTKINPDSLIGRKEAWDKVPNKVLVITAGVDVQDDRVELELVGWGLGEESWGLGYYVIHGKPSKQHVWDSVTDILNAPLELENGLQLHVQTTCIDSGGHYTDAVYKYAKKYELRRRFAIKGQGAMGTPINNGYRTRNKGKVKLYSVGTDAAKELIYAFLQVHTPGVAGYCHFPLNYDEEYFKQLTAEKAVLVQKGLNTVREWRKLRDRNEALDIRVYALAALRILNPKLDQIAKRMGKAAVRLAEENEGLKQTQSENETKSAKPKRPTKRKSKRKGSGFVKNY